MAEANEKPAEKKHPEDTRAHEKETTQQKAAQQGPAETQAPQQQAPAKQQMDEKQARGWAMLSHLGAFVGVLIPFGNIIAPLVIWLIKREESAFVEDQAKESLNFQISLSIYMLVAGLLTFVLIGFVLVPIAGIFGIVVVIIAAVTANKGEKYRYPLCIRFIR